MKSAVFKATSVIVIVLTAVWLCSCRSSFDYSFDTQFAQIGCRNMVKDSSDSPGHTYFRIGMPFIIDNWTVNGIAIGLLGNSAKNVNGLNLSAIAVGARERANGISISGIITYIDGCANGLVIAPVGNVLTEVNGLSVSLVNLADNGKILQLGAVNVHANMAHQAPYRAPLGQLGLLNRSYCAPIFQLGLYNSVETSSTRESTSGIQFGLLNNNGRCIFPLINVCY